MKEIYINGSGVPYSSLHPILKNFYKKLEKNNNISYINFLKENKNTKHIPKNFDKKGIQSFITKIKGKINSLHPRIYIIKNKYNQDIITANNFLLTKNNYYIVTSGLIQFSGFKYKSLYNKVFKIFFKKHLLSSKLKNIFVYSQTAIDEFKKYFKEELKLNKGEYKKAVNKLVLYYPELVNMNKVDENDIKKRINKSEKIKFLFIGRNFVGKGGKELIEALEIISKDETIDKNSFEISIITEFSDNYKKELEKLTNININTYGIDFTQEELEERFYKTHHVLLHLTRADIFGMVSLESKKSGLAVITTKQYVNYPELFKENEALFVGIDEKYNWNDGLPKIDYLDAWYQNTNFIYENQICSSIKEILTNKSKLLELSLNNLQSLERFENKINLDKYL
ncbi:glycosyltransferase [Candidatus Vampirococcus lugosii]|uniref:Glycosyltransferase involved in cell wall bisynthesis n=1 Tax=Candidatus Vampirococcus lugosii TaxID=2789015 RepID=A0ABS5QM24_9BACT|nr:glycosyltransferase [Candidatus Vampirococcus lugosii]MBS8122112.1 Glycosyltransferase involved in cell wall bisynthesis [Candidatus Vampirococcus lugosii]